MEVLGLIGKLYVGGCFFYIIRLMKHNICQYIDVATFYQAFIGIYVSSTQNSTFSTAAESHKENITNLTFALLPVTFCYDRFLLAHYCSHLEFY